MESQNKLNYDLDIQIRAASIDDAAEIANVHISSWREAYEGLLDQEYLNNMPLQFKNRFLLWKQLIPESKQIIYLAEHKKYGVIGFVNGGKARDPSYEGYAEIYAIYLLKKFHGQGIGKQLLFTQFNDLKAKGYKKAYLWVLKGNPTIKFYEKSGAIFSGDITKDEIAGTRIEELCYRWEKIPI